MDPAGSDQGQPPPANGTRRGPRGSSERGPPIEHSRLATGCLWGVPLSLGLWALIFYALWRALS